MKNYDANVAILKFVVAHSKRNKQAKHDHRLSLEKISIVRKNMSKQK